MRSRRAFLVVAALVVAAIAVGFVVVPGYGRGGPPRDSGVRGARDPWPLTPVERLGGPPNEKPYAATIRVVRRGSDDTVATARSGADGRFSVDLKPGAYTLVPQSPGPLGLPHASALDVTVAAHRFTEVRIAYDTGIR
jgi:hypothetical protein